MATFYEFLDYAGLAIYISLGMAALFGVFTVIMVLRRIRIKRFNRASQAEEFLDEIRENLRAGNIEAVIELCDSPRLWAKAVPQLVILAMANRHHSPTKMRRMLAERFETEVLADLEYRAGWIATVVKSAPMLGLLGTVIGMILSFRSIAGTGEGETIDPTEMADSIGVALFTTALGLTVAIPLVILGAMVAVRMGKLADAVQQHVGRFVDDYDAVQQDGRKA